MRIIGQITQDDVGKVFGIIDPPPPPQPTALRFSEQVTDAGRVIHKVEHSEGRPIRISWASGGHDPVSDDGRYVLALVGTSRGKADAEYYSIDTETWTAAQTGISRNIFDGVHVSSHESLVWVSDYNIWHIIAGRLEAYGLSVELPTPQADPLGKPCNARWRIKPNAQAGTMGYCVCRCESQKGRFDFVQGFNRATGEFSSPFWIWKVTDGLITKFHDGHPTSNRFWFDQTVPGTKGSSVFSCTWDGEDFQPMTPPPEVLWNVSHIDLNDSNQLVFASERYIFLCDVKNPAAPVVLEQIDCVKTIDPTTDDNAYENYRGAQHFLLRDDGSIVFTALRDSAERQTKPAGIWYLPANETMPVRIADYRTPDPTKFEQTSLICGSKRSTGKRWVCWNESQPGDLEPTAVYLTELS